MRSFTSNSLYVRLQLYREEKIITPKSLSNSELCIHVESMTLADRTYELVPQSESEQREAQVNLTEVTEDPNQVSEEPKAIYAQEGKPRSMSFYFKFMQLIIVPIYLCI